MTLRLPRYGRQSATVVPPPGTEVTPPTERIPGMTWLQYAHPEDAGFASAKLTEARACWESLDAVAQFVVYQGAVLIDWGETARRFSCHSVRKSLMSAMYGVYIDQGIIDTTKTLAQLGIDDIPRGIRAAVGHATGHAGFLPRPQLLSLRTGEVDASRVSVADVRAGYSTLWAVLSLPGALGFATAPLRGLRAGEYVTHFRRYLDG